MKATVNEGLYFHDCECCHICLKINYHHLRGQGEL